ncbi:MAG: single-stranded DNA-binding protein [Patescibacteria group bacterium]|nr:single-stranded DNA-binding protein [Patescibacteria group bacterium]
MSLFDLNRATLIGNVTKDPQLKYTSKGTAVITFGIATNRSVQNEDGSYKDLPTYHNIVAWSRLAERLGKVVTKGKKVYVEGRIENRNYEKDGQTRYVSEIVADNVIVFDRSTRATAEVSSSEEFGTAPSSSRKSSSKKHQDDLDTGTEAGAEDINPDDIPF